MFRFSFFFFLFVGWLVWFFHGFRRPSLAVLVVRCTDPNERIEIETCVDQVFFFISNEKQKNKLVMRRIEQIPIQNATKKCVLTQNRRKEKHKIKNRPSSSIEIETGGGKKRTRGGGGRGGGGWGRINTRAALLVVVDVDVVLRAASTGGAFSSAARDPTAGSPDLSSAGCPGT